MQKSIAIIISANKTPCTFQRAGLFLKDGAVLKLYAKKALIIGCATMLFILMTFVQPKEKAEAAVWLGAVPAGITVGAGAYYVGALALAGLVGVAGYDTYSEEINAHAKRAWENGTQLSKDSMNAMIEGAKGLGNVMAKGDAAFNDWVDSQIAILGEGNTIARYGTNVVGDSSKVMKENYESNEGQVISIYSGSDQLVMARGHVVRSLTMTIGKYDNEVRYMVDGLGWQYIKLPQYANNASIKQKMISAGTDIGLITAVFGSVGMSFVIGNADVWAEYQTNVSRTSEAWQDMRDAGLVLPVDSAVPTYQGQKVNWNAETDVYTGVDGGVISKGDLTWSFPQPKIRTGTETDIPVTVPPGVYIDNPAADGTSIGSTTNVLTGETTTVKTDTPIEEPAPGEGGSTTPAKINFKPLIMLAGAITEKFPFSIPWDVFDLFSQFNVEPISPVFEIGSGKDIYLGDMRIPVKYDFDIDFSKFDPLAMIIRWGEILVFDICLILALRRLTPD